MAIGSVKWGVLGSHFAITFWDHILRSHLSLLNRSKVSDEIQ